MKRLLHMLTEKDPQEKMEAKNIPEKAAIEERIRRSPQFRDGRFRNTTPWEWMKTGDYVTMMREYMFTGRNRTPRHPVPRRETDLSHFTTTASGQLNATWLGHSSLLIHIDGCRIITDPVLQSRITLMGPWRYSGPPPVEVDRIPDADIALLSHNHFDHLNAHTIRRLHGRIALFLVPLGLGAILRRWGVPAEKVVELDWWEAYGTDRGLRITATPAQHFSGRTMLDRDRTLWASFVVEGPKHKIFFGGDSGYFGGFREIGKTFGPFDMTFLETGAYNHLWHAVHMFPEETVQAHLDLGGTVLHPIHWGTFNLSLHAWNEPMERLVRKAIADGVRTATPIVGETTVFDRNIPSEVWWEDRNEG